MKACVLNWIVTIKKFILMLQNKKVISIFANRYLSVVLRKIKNWGQQANCRSGAHTKICSPSKLITGIKENLKILFSEDSGVMRCRETKTFVQYSFYSCDLSKAYLIKIHSNRTVNFYEALLALLPLKKIRNLRNTAPLPGLVTLKLGKQIMKIRNPRKPSKVK